VVVNRYSKFLLGSVLTNDVLVQIFFQFKGAGKLTRRSIALLLPVVFNNGIANRYALVTYISTRVITRRRNEFTDNVLTFVAEGTAEGII
jgi:hypothetical protein